MASPPRSLPQGVHQAYEQWLQAHPDPGDVGSRGWRQACVHHAADLLSQSVGKVGTDAVLELIGFGSKTDIARDIDAWREDDTRRRTWWRSIEHILRHPAVLASISKALEELTRSITTQAQAAAQGELQPERDRLAQLASELEAQRTLLNQERDAARAEAQTARDLALEHERTAQLHADHIVVLQEQLRAGTEALSAERASGRDRERALEARVTAATEELKDAAARMNGLQTKVLMEVEHGRQAAAALDARLKSALEALRDTQEGLTRATAQVNELHESRRDLESRLAAAHANLDTMRLQLAHAEARCARAEEETRQVKAAGAVQPTQGASVKRRASTGGPKGKGT